MNLYKRHTCTKPSIATHTHRPYIDGNIALIQILLSFFAIANTLSISVISPTIVRSFDFKACIEMMDGTGTRNRNQYVQRTSHSIVCLCMPNFFSEKIKSLIEACIYAYVFVCGNDSLVHRYTQFSLNQLDWIAYSSRTFSMIFLFTKFPFGYNKCSKRLSVLECCMDCHGYS